MTIIVRVNEWMNELINWNSLKRYFRDLGITDENYAPGKERERADEIIKDEKKKNPGKINYFASASREYPGKFMLTYLPRNHAKHEFITVAPEGFRFRGQMFTTLALVFGWFKKHFRDPIPGTPVSSRGGNQTSGSMSTRTPGYAGGATTPNVGSLSGVNSETLQRVAQSIPSHMLHSLTQAAHFQGDCSHPLLFYYLFIQLYQLFAELIWRY